MSSAELAAPAMGVQTTYREAIRRALHDELEADNTVVFFGEDVAEAGGPFKTSEGLLEEFGPQRVWDTPICENGFVGAGLGMAVTGLRPVIEIMFSDFLATAGDAMTIELPKFRFMSGGQTNVPITVRSLGGGTGSFGTQHSATGESWFQQFPGLFVVTASSPASAYGLLRRAIRLDDPVLFIEHRGMYALKEEVDYSAELPRVGKAEIVRPGSDITIAATLLMVPRSLQAAEALAKEGVDAEVIDLRWINPLDLGTVRESVSRTGRLAIAEEQVHAGGWGATLISELVQSGVQWQGRPRTASMPPMPIAYSPVLENAAIPTADRIAETVRAAMAG